MVSFINSWFDPPKAKEAAFAMIDKGADVMYAERFGVSRRGQGTQGADWPSATSSTPRTSTPTRWWPAALWNMEPTIDLAIKMVKDGKFKAADYGSYSMMKHKGSELAPLGTFEKKIPADIVAKVQAKEKAILAGQFNVKVDDNQPKPTAK